MHGAAMTQTHQTATPYRCVMSDSTPEQSFATLIRDGRRRKGWSQDELEEHSGGVSRSTISRWERGLADKPEPDHVRAVCRALDLDPREAAVALGYLTREEIGERPYPLLDPAFEDMIRDLEDPAVPVEDKQSLIRYLRFLRAERQAGGGQRNVS